MKPAALLLVMMLVVMFVTPILFMRTKETFVLGAPMLPPVSDFPKIGVSGVPTPFGMMPSMPGGGGQPMPSPFDLDVGDGDAMPSSINGDVKIDNSGIGTGNGGGGGGTSTPAGGGGTTALMPLTPEPTSTMTAAPTKPATVAPTPVAPTPVAPATIPDAHDDDGALHGATLGLWEAEAEPMHGLSELDGMFRHTKWMDKDISDAFGNTLGKCAAGNSAYLCHSGERVFGRNKDNNLLCDFSNMDDVPNATMFVSCETTEVVDNLGFVKASATPQRDDAACKAYLEASSWPYGTKLNTERPDSIWVALHHGGDTEGFVLGDTGCKGLPWKQEYQEIVNKRIFDEQVRREGSVSDCDRLLMNDVVYGAAQSAEEGIGYDAHYKWPNTDVMELDRIATKAKECKVYYDKTFDDVGCRKQIKNFVRNNADAEWMTYDYPLGRNWATNITTNATPMCKKHTYNTKYHNVFEDEYMAVHNLDEPLGEVKTKCAESILQYIDRDFAKTAMKKYKMFRNTAATKATINKANETDNPLDAVGKSQCKHVHHSIDSIQDMIHNRFVENCKKEVNAGSDACTAIVKEIEQEKINSGRMLR
jgi:hypothetical protein